MADLSVQNEGSIFILWANTPAGVAWVAEHIPADATRFGKHGTVVEHRYIGDIAAGAINDGLEVE